MQQVVDLPPRVDELVDRLHGGRRGHGLADVGGRRLGGRRGELHRLRREPLRAAPHGGALVLDLASGLTGQRVTSAHQRVHRFRAATEASAIIAGHPRTAAAESEQQQQQQQPTRSNGSRSNTVHHSRPAWTCCGRQVGCVQCISGWVLRESQTDDTSINGSRTVCTKIIHTYIKLLIDAYGC